MLVLQKSYGKSRLEAACKRASISPKITLIQIRNILKNGQDRDKTSLEDQNQDHPTFLNQGTTASILCAADKGCHPHRHHENPPYK